MIWTKFPNWWLFIKFPYLRYEHWPKSLCQRIRFKSPDFPGKYHFNIELNDWTTDDWYGHLLIEKMLSWRFWHIAFDCIKSARERSIVCVACSGFDYYVAHHVPARFVHNSSLIRVLDRRQRSNLVAVLIFFIIHHGVGIQEKARCF